MISGIYGIVNVNTGKMYIGSTKNFSKRWGEHRSTLKAGKHRNPLLQEDWSILGESGFEFIVLEKADGILGVKEMAYINKYSGNCYNIGKNVPTNHSSSTNERQSKRNDDLNKKAQAMGWGGISEYLTAIRKGEVSIPLKAI